MDTRFSVACHTLMMIAGSDSPLSSECIARSVGTNASYIRKITALLKNAGIIESRKGVSGFALRIPPEELTLFAVYQAVEQTERVHIFDVHANPNDKCIVGKHIRPVLGEVFESAEQSARRQLQNTTLAACMDKIREKENRSKTR